MLVMKLFSALEATDSDGKLISYTWDLEGDGFSDNIAQEKSSYTYTFDQAHPLGVNVGLKVEDDAGATAISDYKKIYVISNSAPPVAAFLTTVSGKVVSFKDNTTYDTENGAEYSGIYWDFDTEQMQMVTVLKITMLKIKTKKTLAILILNWELIL